MPLQRKKIILKSSLSSYWIYIQSTPIVTYFLISMSMSLQIAMETESR